MMPKAFGFTSLLVVLAFMLANGGCGKTDSASESPSEPNGEAVPVLEQPMVASVGVGGPPRGSRNGGRRKQERPADAIAAPEVPSDLEIPDEALTLSFRPTSDSDTRYESMVIRELGDSKELFSRKDFLELSVACQANAEGEGVTANITTDRVYVRFEGPQGETEFDTMNAIAYTGNLAKVLTPTLQTLVDEGIAGSVDPRGQFIDLQLPDSFQDEVEANPDVIQYGFAEPFIREIACQLSVPLPDGPVNVGDEWESDTGWSRFGPDIRLLSKYRLEGLSERAGSTCAVVSFETALEGIPDQATSFKELAYSLRGVAYVDRQTGQIVYMSNEANGETTFEIDEGQLQTFPLRFRTRVERISS